MSNRSPLGKLSTWVYYAPWMLMATLLYPTLEVPLHAAEKDGMPVILLTGFEPFGKEKPLNPSWEGIKALDGQRWHEYRLVAKQLPVVWGAPLDKLEQWMVEYQPVAVFSFGQGHPGHFALENRAMNLRGDGKDNLGQTPPNPKIVDSGPDRFITELDVLSLAQILGDKGYPAVVSTNAGRYLCDEALYSLQYLKATKHPEMVTLFCHVPPLKKEGDKHGFTAEQVQQFVVDLLAAWRVKNAAEAPEITGVGLGQPQEGQPQEGQRREVKEFIEGYFRAWSQRDMKGYADCFAQAATIQFLGPRGDVAAMAKDEFVASQREAHQNSSQRMVEVPESIDVRFEARLAEAVVYWKLTAGPRTEFGYDHFRLVRQNGQWKILNLVFYGEKKRR